MKYIILFVFFTSAHLFAQQSMFKIIENDKIGYINNKGAVIIPPVYNNGTDFANGVAAVRQDGLYGIIDSLGNYIAKPKYDYIYEFYNGLTEATLHGKKQVLNTRGDKVLDDQYKSIYLINDSLYRVKTKSDKWGIYNISTHKYTIDTTYTYISEFVDGIAIANSQTDKEPEYCSSLIDNNGNTILPTGKYAINPYVNGIARVGIKNHENKLISGAIDAKGNLLFKYENKNQTYISTDFTDGYAVVNLYKYWIPEKNGIISDSSKSYDGYIDLKGNVVFNDTLFPYCHEFSNKRAFIKKKSGNYMMIDTNFKIVGDSIYDDVLDKKFKSDYAIVKVNDYWGVIDTMGYFKVKPQFDEIDDVGIIDNYLFYRTYNDTEYYYGIATIKDEIILKPIMQDFDRSGFHDGLLKAIVNNRLTYIDTQGNIIWQQKLSKQPKPLNIDYMMNGYFWAYQTDKRKDYNGWAESENFPKKVNKETFPKNKLSLIIDTTKKALFADEYYGCKIYIANTTKGNKIFNAQDSRLDMKLQALDSTGNWKDIEYLRSSWCGNSYHTITLKQNEYWEFTMPLYEGAIKTKIRAKLDYLEGKNTVTLYSNTIDASVNPAQFTIQLPHISLGLMDPY
ncbi:WG repeat-containing protein [Flavobacterium zepuense]|uniref:WG repeat-containing protein n=1 Tax=Flavobacterium zepuense TaxID=2593302 RepID=A0A552V1Q0_9FLAO|nr:WG repeat-containing protein [Flavobacterium zepuense]TRW24372.1 WG repeat-containing protein [Flavobacterium zepuense]